MTRTPLLAGLALGLALSVPGCKRAAPDEAVTPAADGEAEATPVRGDTLVVGYKADVDVLNPVVSSTNLGLELTEVLFPTLAHTTFDCRLDFQPGLAERWEWDEAHTALTLHLRDDARWADGEAVDAADVAFTLDRIRDPAVGSAFSAYLGQLREDEPLEVVDPRTVVVHYDHRYDPVTMMAHAVGFPLIPEHRLADVPPDQLRGAEFSQSPVGGGPFVVERWVRDQELVLARNDRPAATHAPYLDRVIIRVIPEYSTRVLELQNGGVDLVQGLQMEDLPRLQRDHPEIRLHRRGYRKSDFIAWNLRDERFADVRVRTALAHAVDVDTLIAALLTVGDEVYGRRAVGSIPPVLCDAHHDEIEPIPHDLARARALFAEAGWTDSDGDGWLDRDGERFGFTLITNTGNARRERAQVILQEQLRAAGVDVRLEALDSNAVNQALRDGTFEAALWGMFGAMFVDPSTRWQSGDQPYNYGGYASAEVDRLIEQGLAAAGPEQANPIWRELQARVHEDQPYCFLYWRDDVVGVHRRFRDVQTGVLGLFTGIEDWWVPAGEQRHGGPAAEAAP